MRKYNLSQIMKRAWVLKRTGMAMSDSLKLSWKETKKTMDEKRFELNFPELSGTEKQVKYANDIRFNLTISKNDSIRLDAKKWAAKGKTQRAVDTFIEHKMAPLNSILANHTDSKFWINNFKYSRVYDFYEYAKKEYQENL